MLLSGSPLITEFMAVNGVTLADGDGNYSDWIEIHNPTAGTVDLDGWFLSDDASSPMGWRLPAMTIDPGEYLVVFASGQAGDDYVDGGGNLHTNFALSANDAGQHEDLLLIRPDLTVAHAYLDYPEQLPDVSYGVTGFSTDQQTLVTFGDEVAFHVPTAGEDPLGWIGPGFDDGTWESTISVDAAGVLLAEIGTGDVRLVEVQNVSDQPIDTTDWLVLVNNASVGINAVNSVAWALPASIAPGQILYRTDEVGDNYWDAAIDWGAEGPGWAMIVDGAGEVMDFVAWGYTGGQIASLSVDYDGFTDIGVAGQWSGDAAAVGTIGGGPPTDTFVAFDDHQPDYGGGTHANATDYSAMSGEPHSGWLKDIETGDDTNRWLAVTGAGVSYESAQGAPAAGTDAYNVFNGYVDFSADGGNDASLAISGGDHYTYTFSSLDTGDAVTYEFAGTATRGKIGYTNRWTLVTLQGTDSATGDHTSGLGVVIVSPTQIALWTGENHQAGQGFVARWTDIDPGPDGQFAVVCNQYTGSTPGVGSGTADGSKGYGISGIRLEELAPAGPQSSLQRTGNTDGNAAGDLVRSTVESKGAQNAGMTVPFGSVLPARLGIGFSDDQAEFDTLIQTDVGDAMQGANASLWTRIEFEGDDLAARDTLILRVKYDDGFIAYLNGAEVARRNADNPLAWNTAASARRDGLGPVTFEDIDITAYLDELVPDTNLLAIHGQNYGAGNDDFLIVPELLVSGTWFDSQPKWFTSPSPESENGSGSEFPGIVINEIHYDPDVRTELVEFIELYNGGPDPVDLSGWYFGAGLDYVFPGGTTILADGYVVVTQGLADFQAKFGFAALGPWVGLLDGEGELIELRDAQAEVVDRVDYRRGFPWPTVGDSPGRSIELASQSLDNDLGGSWRASLSGPTPGAQNSAHAADHNVAPHMRQVDHSPNQPTSTEDVTVTMKITDPDGVESVTLDYQLVDPGDYININDSRYNNAAYWTTVTMYDDGTGGDEEAGDDVYSAVLPAQANRTLVRYRVTATDTLAASITGPYSDDPQPNFAYYVYDSLPTWTGSARPGVEPDVVYDFAQMEPVLVYTLITQRQDHLNAMYVPYRPGEADQQVPTTGTYGGQDYRWHGALVYDGVVYDHIRYRARGGVWRYSMGKNMWKFDFNRGHSFQARDDYGNLYDTTWDKLNFSALIQQGNFQQRGEQGLFEAAGFMLHNLAGNEAPYTNYAHFRIVEDGDEGGPDQYSTDFQGLYLVTEQPDGRMLDEHDMPDGNFYKMEGGSGTLNNQGPTQPSNRSDLNAFMNGYRNSPTAAWCEANIDLDNYYNFRAIAMAIHDYDMHAGKNYFYYHNPETGKWTVHNWDIDLCWTTTYNGGGGQGPLYDDNPYVHLLDIPELNIDYNSRLRELRDLLFNPEQTGMLLDEIARFVYTPPQPSFVEADRAMWDYNPILVSSYINSSKAAHGRYYQYPPTQGLSRDFAGMIQLEKNYVAGRMNSIDPKVSSDDHLAPNKPTISYVGQPGYPLNRLTFEGSPFSGGSGVFAAMQWRIAEVTDPTSPDFDPTQPRKYEITATWESDEIAVFDDRITMPPAGIEAGGTYRARVRMKDSAGRWSHWSDPVRFVAGESNETELTESLRVTEIMYNPADPPPGGDYDHDEFEFVELRNTGTETLDISGVSFTSGITFSFASSGVTSLDAGQFVVVAKNVTVFGSRYDTSGMNLVGGYSDKLNNGGEKIELSDALDGQIQEFSYNDNWYDLTDGEGFSLTIVDAQADRDEWDNKSNWGASAPVGGSPGTDDGGTAPGAVIINEVLAHSDFYPNDIIELHNTTDAPIDIGGWFLSDSDATVDDLMKYRIAAGTTIPAGGYIIFTEDDNFGLGSGDPGSAAPFALSEFGDDVYLSSCADVEIDGGPAVVPGGYREHVDFGTSPNGLSIGLHVKSTGGSDFTLLSIPTFGPFHENVYPLIDDLVINEVMYHPGDPTAGEIAAGYTNDGLFEFIELYNRGAQDVDLIEYWLGEGVGHTFGWYNADDGGSEVWTLEPGATAAWTTSGLAAATYELFARWDILDPEGNQRDLDGIATYEITHAGGSDPVPIDQNLNPAGWVSLGSYAFNGAAAVVLTRGTADPDEWTIAEEVKLVRTGYPDVLLDDPVLDSWFTANGTATLAPGQYAVIVSNYDAFDYRYDIASSGITVAGAYTGNLGNDGEKIKIRRAGMPELSGYIPYYRADYVNYRDNLPWPVEPDGMGASLSRIEPDAYGNDPGNWGTSTGAGTPGAANVYLDSTGPSVPAGLTAANVEGIRIDLDWQASQEPQSFVDHYVIYRNGSQIDTTPTVGYSDLNAEAVESYSYRLSAVNRDGYESEMSGSVLIAIPGIAWVDLVGETSLEVVFSEAVVPETAENGDNYVLSGGSIVSAVLDVNNVSVMLTTSQMQANQAYTLTVNDVETVSGDQMPANLQESFVFRLEGSGTILREYWTGIGGDLVSNLTGSPDYPDNPGGSNELTAFEGPTNWADSYGTRIRGYIHPPVTGNYVFWIAGDDASELWLSTDAAPANRTLIASVPDWTNSRQWNKYSSQESGEMHLVAGQRYYIEVLHKEGGSGDHVAVAWQMPDLTFEGPIPGIRLSPWTDNQAPFVANPIPDVEVDENDPDTVLDLSDVFDDVDIDDWLTLAVTGNTTPTLVETDIDGTNLTLSYGVNQDGTADITVRATDSVGAWMEDVFTVVVNPAPWAPNQPQLAAGSDTGVPGDSITNLDNGGLTRTLDFDVTATVPGATVTIYVGETALGSTTATGTTTTVTTDGDYDLSDGEHSIAARQTEPGLGESEDSAGLTVTIDTQAPTLEAWYSAARHGPLGQVALEILDDGSFVEPRRSGISCLLLQFSEALDPASLPPASIEVAGLDVTNTPFTPTTQITTSTRDGDATGQVDFAPALPNVARYVVSLVDEAGVTDAAGNPVAGGDADRVMLALVGDVSGDERTDSGDLWVAWGRRKPQISPSDPADVRADISGDGRISSSDLSITWGYRADASGIGIPAPPGGQGAAATVPQGLESLGLGDTTAIIAPAAEGVEPAGLGETTGFAAPGSQGLESLGLAETTAPVVAGPCERERSSPIETATTTRTPSGGGAPAEAAELEPSLDSGLVDVLADCEPGAVV